MALIKKLIRKAEEAMNLIAESYHRLDSVMVHSLYVATLFLFGVFARRRKELDQFRTMGFGVALDRYSVDCEALSQVKDVLKQYILKREALSSLSEYLQGLIPKGWSDAKVGWNACLRIFGNNTFFAQGTNHIPNLAEIVSRFRNGNGPVLLIMDQAGFLPFRLAMNGITCIVRFSNQWDVYLTNLLSIFVGGRIHAELVKPEDMYRKVEGPVSLVVCLSGASLVLETTGKKAKKRWRSLPKKFSWYSGTLLCFTMEGRRLDKWKRQGEEHILKELVKTGCLKKVVKLPFKAGSEPEYQPIMLCLDLSADRSDNGVQMVDISHALFWDKIGKEGQ